MKKDGGPAFPTEHGFTSEGEQWDKTGMSLRDYFAAAAMKGLLASWPTPDTTPFRYELLAAGAYHYADAMLAERERRPNA